MIYNTTNLTENQYRKLLPNYSKKIALGCILLIIILCATALKLNWLENDRIILVEITKVITLLSFLVIFLSKEKLEDELVMHIRLQAIVFTFLNSVLFTILFPISNYFINGTYTYLMEANTVILYMFISYFLTFSYLKRRR